MSNDHAWASFITFVNSSTSAGYNSHVVISSSVVKDPNNSAEANDKLLKDIAASIGMYSSSLLCHISNLIRSDSLKTVPILSIVLPREVKNSLIFCSVSKSAILKGKDLVLRVRGHVLYPKEPLTRRLKKN